MLILPVCAAIVAAAVGPRGVLGQYAWSANLVANPGCEGGSPPASWTQVSGSITCSTYAGNPANPQGQQRSGAAYFGTPNNAGGDDSVSQDVAAPGSGETRVRFGVWVARRVNDPSSNGRVMFQLVNSSGGVVAEALLPGPTTSDYFLQANFPSCTGFAPNVCNATDYLPVTAELDIPAGAGAIDARLTLVAARPDAGFGRFYADDFSVEFGTLPATTATTTTTSSGSTATTTTTTTTTSSSSGAATTTTTSSGGSTTTTTTSSGSTTATTSAGNAEESASSAAGNDWLIWVIIAGAVCCLCVVLVVVVVVIVKRKGQASKPASSDSDPAVEVNEATKDLHDSSDSGESTGSAESDVVVYGNLDDIKSEDASSEDIVYGNVDDMVEQVPDF